MTFASPWEFLLHYDQNCLAPGEKGWTVDRVSEHAVHVYPINDWQPHIMTETCTCGPRVDNQGANAVVVHNAFDGRELFEKLVYVKKGVLNH